MAKFQESAAKAAVRSMLLDAALALGRQSLTYLGMPSERGLDLRTLSGTVTDVIAVDRERLVLDELSRNIAPLGFKSEKLVVADMWEYLRQQYPAEARVADVTFLDFCGGGLRNEDPFATEVAALRSYFAKQAQFKERAFVFAWTFMPRDSGKAVYLDTCRQLGVDQALLQQLEGSSGVTTRSIAARLVLFKSLTEHRMKANLYQHALYKRSMNTIILVFSGGRGDNCQIRLGTPESVLTAELVIYESGRWLPRIEGLLEI